MFATMLIQLETIPTFILIIFTYKDTWSVRCGPKELCVEQYVVANFLVVISFLLEHFSLTTLHVIIINNYNN
jgi:hypothetical protein